jgi:hypothetical protein
MPGMSGGNDRGVPTRFYRATSKNTACRKLPGTPQWRTSLPCDSQSFISVTDGFREHEHSQGDEKEPHVFQIEPLPAAFPPWNERRVRSIFGKPFSNEGPNHALTSMNS